METQENYREKARQYFKESGMATWEYVPEIKDEETKEILSPADVFIRCDNCATIHFLKNHIKEKG